MNRSDLLIVAERDDDLAGLPVPAVLDRRLPAPPRPRHRARASCARCATPAVLIIGHSTKSTSGKTFLRGPR